MRYLLFISLLLIRWSPVTSQSPIQWKLYEAATYQVHFTTAVKADLAVLGNQARDTAIAGSLEGSLRIVCVGQKDSTGKFFCSFTQVDRIQLPLPTADQLQVKDNLQKGFYFFQQQSGVIDSFSFPFPFSDAAEHIAVQLLEYYQLYLPAALHTSWQKEIQVTDGWAVATWAASGTPQKPIVHLTALTPVYDNEAGSVLTRSNQYEADVIYRPGSRLKWQEISGTVKREAKMNHKTITTLTNTINFLLKKVEQQVTPLPEGEQRYVRTIYYPGKLLARARENDLRRSKGVSVEGIWRLLKQNEVLKDENLQDKLAGDIRVIFMAGRDSLDLLRNVFMQADVNGITFKTIRTALITSATPYAQQVLAAYIDANKGNWNVLKKIIPSAGVIATPSYSLQHTLESLAFDSLTADNSRTAAQLALGNMAGTLRKTATARADSIARQLALHLANRGDDMLYISALGNCGTAGSLPYVRPFLTDSNIAIQGMAYYALRFIEEPIVDSLFVNGLLQKQDADLLINIFNALYFRNAEKNVIRALEQVVQNHAEDKVRLAALQLLFNYSYREPALLKTIQRTATSNTSAATKEAAKAFLQRIQ